MQKKNPKNPKTPPLPPQHHICSCILHYTHLTGIHTGQTWIQGWDWVKVWILKGAKITLKKHLNTISIASWEKSESWNPAVAGKVPSMLIPLEHKHYLILQNPSRTWQFYSNKAQQLTLGWQHRILKQVVLIYKDTASNPPSHPQ